MDRSRLRGRCNEHAVTLRSCPLSGVKPTRPPSAAARIKNLLATVPATVNLSQADTPEGLKQAIEGRILALANVHSLFVETLWIGAELSTVARQELAPYSARDEERVRRLNRPSSVRLVLVRLKIG
jgi:two-component sensor histidine kinase